MSRPSDWGEVFGIDDPAPGDPWSVRRVSTSWGSLADDAEYAESKLRTLMSDDAIVGWIGEGGDAFRDKTGELPDQLKKCKDSYRIASDALGWWAGKLEIHQSDADKALVQGRAAKADLEAAQADLASAGQSVSGASGSSALSLSQRYADTPPPAGVNMPSSADVQHAQDRLKAAKASQSAAAGAVSSAESALAAAKQLALDAASLRIDDGKATAGKVHDASDAGIEERSRWDKLKDWVAEAWDIIIKICKIVVLVLGIVALILGGPLAWVVFAAAVLILADTIAKYLKGEASLLDVALAALGCIPGTKGLTTLSELSTAFKAGGALGAGAHLLGATQTMGREILTSANLMRKGFIPGMRAAGGVLGQEGATAVTSLRTTLKDMSAAFSEAKNATASPADMARMWQGTAPYRGIDGYSNVDLAAGTRLEAGAPGIGSYAVDGGTAHAMGDNAADVFEGVQVGPGAAGGAHPGYRDSMVELHVNTDIPAATGTALANPQFGAGGTTQYFLDIKQEISVGNISVLDHGGSPIHIPDGTAPGDIEGAIHSALGGQSGTIHLTGAGSPNSGIMDLTQAGQLHDVPNGFLHILRGAGYVSDGVR
jgi:hypothetical protein